MNMKNRIGAFALAALAGAALAACNGTAPGGNLNPSNPTAPPEGAQYVQVELLSRPAVKEAFESFASHDTTNRTEPYNDPTLQAQIGSFTLNFRSQANASALQSILYPNEMVADLSQATTSASYLGVETGGATGSKFGGRGLSDDVIAISLGALFGNTLSALGVIPDDHKEIPCLTNDNVSYDKQNGSTFPYIQAPL
jgi:hypothetical protein